MSDHNFTDWSRLLRGSFVLALLCLMVLGGCQASEPPLTPAAASFKKEVPGPGHEPGHGKIVGADHHGDLPGGQESEQ